MMVDIWKAFFAQTQCQLKSMWLQIDNFNLIAKTVAVYKYAYRSVVLF